MADEPNALLDELRKLDEALIRANWFSHSVTVLNAIQLIRYLHGETIRLKAAAASFSAQAVQRTCDYEDRIELLERQLEHYKGWFGTECPCDCDVNDDGPDGCPL